MPELTIQIVTWNSAVALKATLPALRQVDQSIAVIRVIDNASTDESVALVRAALPTADIIQLPQNTGFAGGHNTGFDHCTTPFVLIVNPDVTLDWLGVTAVLEYCSNEKIGALQGKLYRESTTIDSTGVMLTMALNGRERGAGEVEGGQYATVTEIDAPTGACALYRIAALQQIKAQNGEIFDEDFWAYKEDVDLGWRLRRRGWKILYVPVVMGIHPRRLRREGAFGWSLAPHRILQRLRERRTRYSWRNWVWMVIKNASVPQLILHSPALVMRLGVLGIFSLLYWPLWTVWPEIIRGIPTMIAKRHNTG